MATRLVTLATFPSPIEAAMARNVLAEAGIRAEATEMANASIWGGMMGGAKVLVDEADLERAGQLLDEAFGEPLDSDDELANVHDESEIDNAGAGGFADNLADRSPVDGEPAWACSVCGTRVAEDDVRCWSCGATRRGEANPYFVRPESAIDSPLPVKAPRSRPSPEQVQDWIDRAWRAACMSSILLPPLLNFYSAWLLLRAAGETSELPASYSAKFYGALVINLVVSAVAIVIWISVVRGSWEFDPFWLFALAATS